jgi:hypothetical protein
MDLNDLYQRRGQSLMMAALARSEAARNAHLALSLGYVEQIEALRLQQRAAVA